MIRLVIILITVTLLSMGVAWIADEPGRVVIEWGEYHIETSLLAMLAGIAISVLWCMILYYILYAVIRTPRSWLKSRAAKRQALGLASLTSAFSAIATQDLRTARKQIAKAQYYLPQHPLTLMLASQAARLEGNESQSRLYLEQMLKAEGGEFMALRGLIENARRSQDDDAAIAHAEKAMLLKNKDPWLVKTLIGLYAKKQRVQEATRLIRTAARKNIIGRTEQRHLNAGVLYQHARAFVAQQRLEQAVASLEEAIRIDPGFVAASARLAKIYLEDSDITGALQVIKTAWKRTPHPQLAHVLLACFESAKMRDKVIRMGEKLARMHPHHRETHFLLANIALKNADAESARNEARFLNDEKETMRSCMLMAHVEQLSGNSGAASAWSQRAQTAAFDPGYGCTACGQAMDDWDLTCIQCGSVGSVAWR